MEGDVFKMVSTEEVIDTIIYYLYNYKSIDNMIDELKEDLIIENVSLKTWSRSKQSFTNTVENQAIALAENKQIKELQFWKKTYDSIFKYIISKYPKLYQYIELRFFKEADRTEIKNALYITFENQAKLDKKLYRLIDKYMYQQELAV